MASKILFITILVFVLINFVSSDFEIFTCESDNKVYELSKILKSGIVPIILVKNESDDPFNDQQTKTLMTNAFKSIGICSVIVVHADTCVGAANYLSYQTYVVNPLLYVLKNGHLLNAKTKISMLEVQKLLARVTDDQLTADAYSFENRMAMYKTNPNATDEPVNQAANPSGGDRVLLESSVRREDEFRNYLSGGDGRYKQAISYAEYLRSVGVESRFETGQQSSKKSKNGKDDRRNI